MSPVEGLIIEVVVQRQKWLLACLYSPHNKHKAACCDSIEHIYNVCQSENISMPFLIGDLNINASCTSEYKCLQDIMDITGLTNIITTPTCFKAKKPTLLDRILTTNTRRIASVLNLNTGISDFHHMVGFVTKVTVPRTGGSVVTYRSYKRFSDDAFREDIQQAPFHVGEIFDELDDVYWYHAALTTQIINEHAPLKQRKTVARPVPFMNAKYRKACHRKSMTHNRYYKCGRTKSQWEAYRKSRNLAAKIRATSVKSYFDQKCVSNVKSNPKVFWETVKPFITSKAVIPDQTVMLNDNDVIISDPAVVCKVFNDHFCTVTDHIGNADHLCDDEDINMVLSSYDTHESVVKIKSHVDGNSQFSFSPTTENTVYKLLNNINPRKSTGSDGIPPKLLKTAAREFSPHITSIINMSINDSVFPHDLKYAELSPIFKASDNLCKKNYRPVSVLPTASKIFEKVYFDQLYEYFTVIFSQYLSAFRKKYNCQHVLLRFLEDWRLSLENKENVGAVLMDLSKAFDCLSHKLLLCKMHAYGVSIRACELMRSYLLCRKQRVKLGYARSEWSNITKGVPQGSILGPLLFNVFVNDLFYYLEHDCDLYNYADDNTVGHTSKHMDILVGKLQGSVHIAMDWFKANLMEANPTKFQAIIISNANCKRGQMCIPITNIVMCYVVFSSSRVIVFMKREQFS